MPAPSLDVVVGRVPALPAAAARALYASSDALGSARELLRGDQNVSAALLLASPSLDGALAPWLDGQPPASARTAREALAHAIRMATRCAPIGLLASSGAVECGPATTLALAGPSSRRYRITPTVAWLFDLLGVARAEHRDTTVIANDLIVERGNRLYAYHDDNARQVADGARAVWCCDAVSIRSNTAVAWLRGIAREEQTIRELVGRVMERFDAPSEIAHQLVRKLIAAGVLVPVRPSLQCDPAAYVRSLPDTAARAPSLRVLDGVLGAFALPGATIAPADVASLDAAVRAVHPLDGAVLQVDGFHAFTGTLGAGVAGDAALLASVALAHEPPARLDGFVKRFIDRYAATGRLVPLLELVHDGFTAGGDVADASAARREGMLARMAVDAVRERRREVVLTGAELRALLPCFEPYRVPNACEIGFRIAARDRNAIESGDYTLVASALTSDGVAKTASRIAEALGAAFTRRVEYAHAADACAGALDVELDYLPLTARREPAGSSAVAPLRNRRRVDRDAGGAHQPRRRADRLRRRALRGVLQEPRKTPARQREPSLRDAVLRAAARANSRAHRHARSRHAQVMVVGRGGGAPRVAAARALRTAGALAGDVVDPQARARGRARRVR